jgi:glycosyltransferase involved in cell wall biosynthesis
MNFEDFKKTYEKVKVTEKNDIKKDWPLVSVCIQTYNHSKYIKQCLESILTQKTNFEFEILLGEDDSEDSTREICKEYAEKHSDKIRLFFHHRENNIRIGGSPTGRFNFLYNLFSAQGKYIALCEGDDYWTDPLKLQKQVDFLESHPECAAVVTEASIVDQNNNVIKENINLYKRNLNQKDIFSSGGWYATASLVCRNPIDFSSYNIKSFNGGDRFLATKLTDNGNLIGYLPDVTCVYRKHTGGIYSLQSEFIKYKKIYQDFKLYQQSDYYRKYPSEINTKLSASLYVMGKHYIQSKDWENYIKSLKEIILLVSFKSKLFHFKMLVSHFILPLFGLSKNK